MRSALCSFALCCFLAGALRAADGTGQITREEGANLVKKWLTGAGYHTRSNHFILDSDPDRSNFPEFYFFSASYEQEQSAPTLGHFAVNRRSADLWDWESCKKLSNSTLRTTQRSLRSKMGLAERDYRKVSRVAPCSGPT